MGPNKCETCGQDLPIAVGNIVDVSDGGYGQNYTGLAVVQAKENSNIFTVVFITGKHAGTLITMEKERLTIVHGYIHIDHAGKRSTIDPLDTKNHKY